MVDRQNREDWKRERSLLALGQALRGEEEPSLVAIGDRADPSWREDAATRHRLARLRREGRAHPELSENPEPSATPERWVTPELSANDEINRFQAEDASASAARMPPETDEPVQADYADAAFDPRFARQREEPVAAAVSEGRRSDAEPRYAAPEPRYAAPEPGYADDERRSSRQDDDRQEWKPLIDPMQVVRGIARSKLLIVAMTILGATLGVAIALSTPKRYEATAELIVDPRDLKLTDRDLTQSVVASDATLAIVENQVRVLTSGTVLNKVVDKLNLVNDPEFNGQGSDGLGMMTVIRSILSRNDGPAAGEGRRRALAVANLAESLAVERGGKTFVISVSATTQNGEKSALIANTMTDVFLQTFGQIQSDTAGRATNELTGRLDELRKGVEVAERKVEDFRAAHDLVDAQGHLISDDEMLKLNQQLAIARARTLELNARAASARSIDVNSVLSGTLPEEINSNTMSELRSQYATLKQEADRAAIRLGPRHPELQALNAQLAGSRERIAGELRRIASSLQVDLRRAVQLEQDLASRLAQLKVRSGDVNSDLVTLRELEREAAAKRSVYEQYLLRAKETGEQKDINTANINVISKAFAPLEPNGPSRAMTVLAGLLAGLASGVGLGAMRGAYASLRETADSRPRRRTEERRTPIEDKAYQPPVPPHAGQVPHPQQQYPRASSDEADQASKAAEQQASIEEIRASLREFREAVRELTESRSRRYF
ncbi:GumC family protein [Mesorhizobium sp.]|uniref:GumC family protein n=1 Tax=Mesorhizobium sp. TaxID=1871066 RepID=UPI000FE31E75|nr:GumC family protein [Mesorhizobium sp.]RWN51339.1 MAG: succinoglycan biosynthesis protein exop [Mesorhizobium sp.]RWN72903.1 MAG: succinoglycan biosynthesis protein exop [Mesorhizobium sp.]RWN72985.1 MAG: succinoglycan biosynthesis protein exop [Mesorhizobium sp.]RWN84437.1 MAG: succinoglycan biosynthesis protein exop [Mesorhizobium sp.]RWO08982.1 MAG: succinoglycan biosynthesis protein exop [Mesorhizobium sp.]